MYMLVSLFLLLVSICCEDVRLMAFSAIFALIDMLSDYRKRKVEYTYILKNDFPKIPAGKISDSSTMKPRDNVGNDSDVTPYV